MCQSLKDRFTDDVAKGVSDADEADGVEAEAEDESESFRHHLLENPDRRKSEFQRIGKKLWKVKWNKPFHRLEHEPENRK